VAPLPTMIGLGFTNTEYLGSTARAFTLSGRALVLHDNSLGVFDFNLLSALHTIRLHFNLLIDKS